MKKAIFAVMALVAVAGGAAAFQNQAVKAPKADIVYTYYLENECDSPVHCSPDYEGTICETAFSGSIVYDAPGCLPQNQTSNIIGKRQP